jgi:hypothetical protein
LIIIKATISTDEAIAKGIADSSEPETKKARENSEFLENELNALKARVKKPDEIVKSREFYKEIVELGKFLFLTCKEIKFEMTGFKKSTAKANLLRFYPSFWSKC